MGRHIRTLLVVGSINSAVDALDELFGERSETQIDASEVGTVAAHAKV